MILVPLHLLAFALLYAAVYHFTLREVTNAYKNESEVFLTEAVGTIRSAMSCASIDELERRMKVFMGAHRSLGLMLYDSRGRPVSPATPPDPSVRDFLSSGHTRLITLDTGGGTTTLKALEEIRADAQCTPCHIPGRSLGAVLVTRDLSTLLRSTRRRIGIGLALMVGGWIGLVVLVNAGTRRLTAASVDALKASVSEGQDHPGRASAPLGMDPISHELYRALERTLREQREQRANMEDCIERAERLASLGQLAAGLAHEIKNPLAGIQGALELLADECTDGEQRELYRRMIDELRRVSQTLHSLLHFARPSPPRRLRVDVHGLLEDIAGLVRPGLSRKDIVLRVSADESISTFSLDPDQIRQALVNLVTNAADAIGSSGTIEILARPFPEGEGLILAVSDDGPGIEESIQREIFEPFFTTKLHGTGLGLAVARKIVEDHGGRIEVASEPGRGTTLFLILPHPGDGPPATETRET